MNFPKVGIAFPLFSHPKNVRYTTFQQSPWFRFQNKIYKYIKIVRLVVIDLLEFLNKSILHLNNIQALTFGVINLRIDI